jgi:hypothetical protein
MEKVNYPNISLENLEGLVDQDVPFLEIAAVDFVENRFLPARLENLRSKESELSLMGIDVNDTVQFTNFCRAYGYYYAGIMYVQEKYLADKPVASLKRGNSAISKVTWRRNTTESVDEIDSLQKVNLNIQLKADIENIGAYNPESDDYSFNMSRFAELLKRSNFYEMGSEYRWGQNNDKVEVPLYLSMLTLGMHEAFHRRDEYFGAKKEVIPPDLLPELKGFYKGLNTETDADKALVAELYENNVKIAEQMEERLNYCKGEGRELLLRELKRRGRELLIFRNVKHSGRALWELDRSQLKIEALQHDFEEGSEELLLAIQDFVYNVFIPNKQDEIKQQYGQFLSDAGLDVNNAAEFEKFVALYAAFYFGILHVQEQYLSQFEDRKATRKNELDFVQRFTENPVDRLHVTNISIEFLAGDGNRASHLLGEDRYQFNVDEAINIAKKFPLDDTVIVYKSISGGDKHRVPVFLSWFHSGLHEGFHRLSAHIHEEADYLTRKFRQEYPALYKATESELFADGMAARELANLGSQYAGGYFVIYTYNATEGKRELNRLLEDRPEDRYFRRKTGYTAEGKPTWE